MKTLFIILSILLVLYPAYIVIAKFRNNFGGYFGLMTLGAFPLTVSGYFNVWPEKSQDLIFATLLDVAIFLGYWFIEMSYIKKLKDEQVIKETVSKKYDEIQSSFGNLNELTERELTDEERGHLLKQIKLTYWFTSVMIALEIAVIIWIYLSAGNSFFIYLLLVMVALTILGIYLENNKGNRYLKQNVMFTLKAVVLDKKIIDLAKSDEHYIVLGDKEDEKTYDVRVEKKLFNKTNYGDVMLVEDFDKSFGLGHNFKVEIVGSIMKGQPPPKKP